MEAPNDFSLILGCGGCRHNNVVICAGTSNVIINFSQKFDSENVTRVIDFIDSACSLFDKPVYDWNKVINTLKILHNDYSMINDKMWEALHTWIPLHKKCGAYLKLELNNILRQENIL